MAILLRIRFKQNEDRIEVNESFYNNFDSKFSKYRQNSCPEYNGISSCRTMISEILDNFYPRTEPHKATKSYDKEFSYVDIYIKISETESKVEVEIKHDGNDFNPFAPDSPCLFIKDSANFLKIRPTTTTLGGSGRPTKAIKFSFDPTDTE